jgi:hypothetical protein
MNSHVAFLLLVLRQLLPIVEELPLVDIELLVQLILEVLTQFLIIRGLFESKAADIVHILNETLG